jgi:regulator of cell morphogenesis and NO signaling
MQTRPIQATQTLAELAVAHPGASRVLHDYGLDYCCGGRRTLEQACDERRLNADDVLQSIQQLDASNRKAPDWPSLPLASFTQSIIDLYHEPLRIEFPSLIALAERVESRHAGKAECPVGLAQHLRSVHEAVLMHLDKEEQVLFPMIAAGHGQQTVGPIHVMEDEHHEHAANLRKIRQLAHDFHVPDEACSSWRALYMRLEALEADLMEHIHLENNILFPRALCE